MVSLNLVTNDVIDSESIMYMLSLINNWGISFDKPNFCIFWVEIVFMLFSKHTGYLEFSANSQLGVHQELIIGHLKAHQMKFCLFKKQQNNYKEKFENFLYICTL